MCYLFSSDDKGHLYRSETSICNFPNGMTNTVIAKYADNGNKYSLYEASNVYHLTSGGYLLIEEAIGSDWDLCFRSWTSSAINSQWNELAASESNPFTSSRNVQFPNGQWTRSISPGEMVRTQVDKTLSISPCGLRYLYQGLDPNASGNYDSLPWKLGLLTQTNSNC